MPEHQGEKPPNEKILFSGLTLSCPQEAFGDLHRVPREGLSPQGAGHLLHCPGCCPHSKPQPDLSCPHALDPASKTPAPTTFPTAGGVPKLTFTTPREASWHTRSSLYPHLASRR